MGGGRQGRGGNGWMKGTLLVTDDGTSIPYYYDSQIITIEHKYTVIHTKSTVLQNMIKKLGQYALI